MSDDPEGDAATALDTEVELISASILPSETVRSSASDVWPRTIVISSTDTGTSIYVKVDQRFPNAGSVDIEVKQDNMDREEALEWKGWVAERLKQWEQEESPSLYELVTEHFLPLLAPAEPEIVPQKTETPSESSSTGPPRPHHVLLTSHHLIAPSKRKDLHSLSSSRSLVGFAKTGHPGIIYATGERDDLTEWLREVKSWQWLALRVRIGVEPIPAEITSGYTSGSTNGAEDGARGGKGRGEWQEVEKINEALDWLKLRGSERLLLDIGMGGGPG